MRRRLGLMVGMAALCVVSWAQLPGENAHPAPTYPRAELFGGYSYGMTESFNSGHVARPNGWNVSLGLNVAKWMGFVFEGNGLYGTSKIPRAVPSPFPACPPLCFNGSDSTFNVNTKLYNFLVGAQFPYRKSERFTPFGEVLFGHAGVRGVTHDRDNTPWVRNQRRPRPSGRRGRRLQHQPALGSALQGRLPANAFVQAETGQRRFLGRHRHPHRAQEEEDHRGCGPDATVTSAEKLEHTR